MTSPFHAIANILRADFGFQILGEDRLAYFLETQSLSLYGQRANKSEVSPQAPLNVGYPPFFHSGAVSGQRWNFDFALDNSGFRCTNVDYRPEDGEMANMPLRVFDRIEWKGPRIETQELAVDLPLRPEYLIAMGTFKGGSVGQAQQIHPLWRIESQQDCSIVMAFGYRLEDLTVIPQEITQGLDFRKRFEEEGGAGNAMAVVLVELVLCKPKVDFDPFFGSHAARIYPLCSVCVNRASDIQWELKLTRPKVSSMKAHAHMDTRHQMEPSYQIRSAFWTDTASPGWIGPVPVPDPNWDELFAYYNTGELTGGVRARTLDVVNTKGPRTLASLVSRTESGKFIDVEKVARQGAYDNIHMAPWMRMPNNRPVVMAPICQHDCLHIHWRWSQGFYTLTDLPVIGDFDPLYGWGPAGPNSVKGAVMIPLNQTLQIRIDETHEVTYIAHAAAQPANDWAIFMHHGGAYVDRVTFLAELAPLYEYWLHVIGIHLYVALGGPVLALVGEFDETAFALAQQLAIWHNDWAGLYNGLRRLPNGRERLTFIDLAKLEDG